MRAYEWKQYVTALEHAAAEHNNFGREQQRQRHAQLRDIVRLHGPHRVVVRNVAQLGRRHAAARGDRGRIAETLEAVAVVRAVARVRVVGVARDANVAALGVREPVERAAVDHDADADAGADRHIAARGNVGAVAAEVELGQRGRIHVGLETDRHAERAKVADNIRVFPQGFGRRRDVALRADGRWVRGQSDEKI